MMYDGEYEVGTLVKLVGDIRTVYIITRVYPCMLSEDEYDGASLSGSSFAHLPESELILVSDQKLDTTDDDYDRAMGGI